MLQCHLSVTFLYRVVTNIIIIRSCCVAVKCFVIVPLITDFDEIGKNFNFLLWYIFNVI